MEKTIGLTCVSVKSGRSVRFLSISIAGLLWSLCVAASGQIGGKTAADGMFVLEDVEDMNLSASGVQRAWVPANSHSSTPLHAVSLTSAGLTLAAGQTPAGALAYPMRSFQKYFDYSVGVPMPSVPGASTLTSPGNITSFAELSFLTCYSQNMLNQKLMVVLECYPQTGTADGQPLFPKAIWGYSATAGTQFQKITLNLRAPDQLVNAASFTLEQMLAQTRFLAFYYYGGPVETAQSVTAYVDDIKLEPPVATVDDWALYD